MSVRPELTEEQRAAIRVDIDPGARCLDVDWVVAAHDDPEVMRRCAASSHLLLRSRATRPARLPPDVVERLARDEDRVVCLLLAESCDDAPAVMLPKVWQWWNGSLSRPGRPRSHPNFPRRDLLQYADDPHPRMRRLALDDPESTAESAERFSRDPDEEIRLRAAKDVRLSAASAVYLLDDPDASLRAAASRHPRLPTRVLVGLLLDVETADQAVCNPSIPLAVMHRKIDRAAEPPARAG
ncbi:hypothetical protein J7E88_09165 [Streptomyces sp. ISL-10]|uniref:hypothetical protein n=1 Tax=Streptomyces sp. ISL-10 TaxID=2819172 RepID=UPI001BE63661|nr:hypothetical protein [Streptomyces sp. ISL-10]MBT2365485.1 hypothetical protein [Streptomyces sp. ISL-10]